MAIDYGRKRAGIAISDENRIIANPLKTLGTKDIFIFLEDYLRKEIVDVIVVGYPKQMNNKPSESVGLIESFCRKLMKVYPGVVIDQYDERFTSKIASRVIATSGLKRKDRQSKELIDQVSAVLILQSYMHYLTNK